MARPDPTCPRRRAVSVPALTSAVRTARLAARHLRPVKAAARRCGLIDFKRRPMPGRRSRHGSCGVQFAASHPARSAAAHGPPRCRRWRCLSEVHVPAACPSAGSKGVVCWAGSR